MSDGECTNPVHSRSQPRFSQSETHCRECGGPKWKWASWSRARERMRVLVHEIAAFERGRSFSGEATARWREGDAVLWKTGSDERGVVASVSAEYRTASVVWTSKDGSQSRETCQWDDLTRADG